MCDDLIQWVGDQCEELIHQERQDDMFALYMEWAEWIEAPETTPVVVLEQQPPKDP
jgi:hypothetical protein